MSRTVGRAGSGAPRILRTLPCQALNSAPFGQNYHGAIAVSGRADLHHEKIFSGREMAFSAQESGGLIRCGRGNQR